MASKASRHRRKKKRRYRSRAWNAGAHEEAVLDSVLDTGRLLAEAMQCSDSQAGVERRIGNAADRLADTLSGYEPLGTLEVIRMMTLPFGPLAAASAVGADKGLAVLEVFATALVGVAAEEKTEDERMRVDQDLCRALIDNLFPLVEELLHLAAARDLLAADANDEMARISAAVRGSGRTMRQTSYPEMQDATLRGLFGESAIDAALHNVAGFGVDEAMSFLHTCHDMQMEQLQRRVDQLADAYESVGPQSEQPPSEQENRDGSNAVIAFFNPVAEQAAVQVSEVAARAGMQTAIGIAIAGFFSATGTVEGPRRAIQAYLDGDSPIRKRPLVVDGDRVMIVHPALIADAVRARFEAILKESGYWETYALHRGQYLESRVAEMFEALIPGVTAHHAIEYFVPANEDEADENPAGYTKRVEGDHLFVLDDVAFIVEDKAVPLNDRSRIGDREPLRRNLASAIKKGADQASRMKQRIVDDQGLRLADGTWLELSNIREIHTIVTSLDDMPGVATATAQLVQAGLLDRDNIPWTVSLNDLDLIRQLIDRPAEFLLYLRRRTDPRATKMFVAIDELDLLMVFFDTGLYVEPDPTVAVAEMPWVDKPRTADLRRFKEQIPSLVTSHTDALDAWYYSLHPPKGAAVSQDVPKPCMTPSPIAPLIDKLQRDNDFAWLSIGAALLEGSADFQRVLAATPSKLTNNPSASGEPRSMFQALGNSKKDSWALVWMTRPPTMASGEVIKRARIYMVAKKHQIGLARGVSFVYDEPTGDLVDVFYDSGQTELDPDRVEELVAYFKAPDKWQTQAQLTQRRRAEARAAKRKKRTR